MYQQIFLLLTISLTLGLLRPAFAEHNDFEGHDHESKIRVNADIPAKDIDVLPGEVVIIVHGIVCSFCSQGVTRNLSRLSFIDNSKYTKGVKVEIENQKVTIAIKNNNEIDLKKVFQSILKGGYEPVEAYVSDSEGQVTVHKAEDEQR